MVCELCAPRAAHEGWIREGADAPSDRRRAARRDAAPLAARAPARARGRARGRAPRRGAEAPPRPTARARARAPARRRRRRARAPTAAARAAAREPRHVRAVPTSAEHEDRRARSSSSTPPSTPARSPASRARSARPSCRVRPPSDGASVVDDRRRVGAVLVPLRGRPRPTRPAGARRRGQGYELDELDAEEREPQRGRRRARRAHAGAERSHDRRAIARSSPTVGSRPMIYCVVPEALADELYDKLVALLRRRPERDGDRRPPQGRAPRAAARADGAAQRERPRPPPRRACRASFRRCAERSRADAPVAAREGRRPRGRRRARQPRARPRSASSSARPTASVLDEARRAASARRPTTSPSTARCCSGSSARARSAPTRSRWSATPSWSPSRSTASTRSSTPAMKPLHAEALRGARRLRRAGRSARSRARRTRDADALVNAALDAHLTPRHRFAYEPPAGVGSRPGCPLALEKRGCHVRAVSRGPRKPPDDSSQQGEARLAGGGGVRDGARLDARGRAVQRPAGVGLPGRSPDSCGPTTTASTTSGARTSTAMRPRSSARARAPTWSASASAVAWCGRRRCAASDRARCAG